MHLHIYIYIYIYIYVCMYVCMYVYKAENRRYSIAKCESLGG